MAYLFILRYPYVAMFSSFIDIKYLLYSSINLKQYEPIQYNIIQSQLIVNPKPFLADLTGKDVRVRLKWGQEYQGKLESSDAYMNLQLKNTEEFIDGQFAGVLGEVLIRCNNVLYIKAADLSGSGGDAAMQE